MPGDPCGCCPSLAVPQSLIYVDGAICCPFCDAALRFPALRRECEALSRLMADVEGVEL